MRPISPEVVTPSDAGYDTYRCVWNGMIDRRPLVIVRCRGVADVTASLRYAREHALPVSVRGGGHNVAGLGICDGIVIDLSLMRGVRVDPERRLVRVEGGALLGDVDREAQAFGLAVPMGIMSRTGVAGLTLHGGIGLLMRRFGLTLDNLVSTDVVTADGAVLLADERRHADLFWALRGGGGNFGVVTSFEFQAHPVGPDVWMALVLYPVQSAPAVMDTFCRFMERASDDLVGFASFWTAAHEDPVPPQHHGKPVLILAACYSGPVEQGEAVVAPLRTIVPPLVDRSARMPFLAVQSLFDPEYPDGRRYYWKSVYLSRLDEDVVMAIAHHASTRPSPLTSLDVVTLGGAVARVAPEATAFAQRTAPYVLAIEANWDDPSQDEANVAWARAAYADMLRFSALGDHAVHFLGWEALIRNKTASARGKDQLDVKALLAIAARKHDGQGD